MEDNTSVKVAVRIRPPNVREKQDTCQICTSVTPGFPQVVLGRINKQEKAFTFDYVFDIDSQQRQIYTECCQHLIEGTFSGYNATIIAYGQTGSGKTFTMGTGLDADEEDMVGIIPRAVSHLFQGIESRASPNPDNQMTSQFKVNVQFIELHNEDIIDLLDNVKDQSDRPRKHIRIHEDANGAIYTTDVTTRTVSSYDETICCLKEGAMSRTTGSTCMNLTSSRSHAIFTLHIRQNRYINIQNDSEESGVESSELESLSAKFHFVDLAGSERMKRTGATGERAREGISINCGLLALGNVISVLGDKSKRGMHVPYRDSKLTRLLQDSLGGNSRTLMIACISPADTEFMETLSTLQYANRTRNIRNRVIVNQDKASQQISQLREQIVLLEEQLKKYKMAAIMNGQDGLSQEQLLAQIDQLMKNNDDLRSSNVQLRVERDAILLKGNHDKIDLGNVATIIEPYVQETEDLRYQLIQSEATIKNYKSLFSQSSVSDLNMRSSIVASNESGSMVGWNLNEAGSLVASSSSHTDDTQSNDDKVWNLIDMAKKNLNEMKQKTRIYSDGGDADKILRAISNNKIAEGYEGVPKEIIAIDDVKEDMEEIGDNGDATVVGIMDEEEIDEDEDEHLRRTEVDLQMTEDLVHLNIEISFKQKLIDELEALQINKINMKKEYDAKVQLLQQQIINTQNERDRMLELAEHNSEENSSKLKLTFEKKIQEMETELKKVELLRLENQRAIRDHQNNEKRLRQMQQELIDMKKQKVQLMNKMKDEAQKFRQAELERNREIHQLKKNQRQKDNLIKNLEAQHKQKEGMIKRKQEEVKLLRKKQTTQYPIKNQSKNNKVEVLPLVPVVEKIANVATIAPRFQAKAVPSKISTIYPRTTKRIWDTIEKSLSCTVLKKQNLTHHEKDMHRWIKQRESLTKQIEYLNMKLNNIENTNQRKEILKQLEGVKSSLSYTQDNINECQSNIIQIDELKEEEVDTMSLISKCSLTDTKYLLEKCFNLIVAKGILVAEKQEMITELSAKLHQEKMGCTYQRDILSQLIQQPDNNQLVQEIDHSLFLHPTDSESEDEEMLAQLQNGGDENCSPITNDDYFDLSPFNPQSIKCQSTPLINNKAEKARRKTATTEELLYATSNIRQLNYLNPIHENVTSPVEEVLDVTHTIMSQPDFRENNDIDRDATYVARDYVNLAKVETTSNPIVDKTNFSLHQPVYNNSLASGATNGLGKNLGDDKETILFSYAGVAPNTGVITGTPYPFADDGTFKSDYCNAIDLQFNMQQYAKFTGVNMRRTENSCNTQSENITCKNLQNDLSGGTNCGMVVNNCRQEKQAILNGNLNNNVNEKNDQNMHNNISQKISEINDLPSMINAQNGLERESKSKILNPLTTQVISDLSNGTDSFGEIHKTKDLKNMPPPKNLTTFRPRNGINTNRLRMPMNSKNPTNPSPLIRRKILATSSSSGSISKMSSASDIGEISPPGSPSQMRRPNNVFNRLTMRTQPASPFPPKGSIQTSQTKLATNFPLTKICTANGHSKPVLNIYATDELLFTCSKDRTAKIWDLGTCEDMLTVGPHPNNVASVKFNQYTGLLYTVSTHIIKVWDPRQKNLLIKTLTSSGMTQETSAATATRQVTCPPGEVNIVDIALNSTGTNLYAAANNIVRIWDMRNFKSVGKLAGSHQAAIMVMALDDTDTADGNICIVTGSKDHYIKVFDVMEDSIGVIGPRYNLDPPHYDGIQSLCLLGDLLFSGSRDTCIKKWDIAEQNLKHSINNAHKDWVCGLCLVPSTNMLMSGCRGGVLKTWHVDNCQSLGEVNLEVPINAITNNSHLVFVATNDKSIHFWKPNEQDLTSVDNE